MNTSTITKEAKARDLALSYPACFDRRSKAPEVAQMVKDLMADFRRWSWLQRVSPIYYSQFTTILLELLLVARSLANYLTVPRRHDALNGNSRRITLNVIDYLIATGYVVQVDGFNDGDFGRRSQLKPTQKLHDLWESYGIEKRMIEYNRPAGVRMTKRVKEKTNGKRKSRSNKNGKPKTITVDVTPVRLPRKAKPFIERLDEINQALSTIRISHTMDEALQKKLVEVLGHIPELPENQIVQLKRVFNERMDAHGRFWSTTFHYQNLPWWGRSHFLFKGDPVTAWDFDGAFINILYAERGKQLVGDPYLLEGYSEDHRTFIKRVTNIMLNSKSPKGVMATLRANQIPNSLGDYSATTLRPLMDAIRKKHDVLEGKFFTKQNGRLTLIESNICEQVLLKMLKNKRGVLPVLPEHDSFMVTEGNEDELVQAMKASFEEVLNADYQIGVSKKY